MTNPFVMLLIALPGFGDAGKNRALALSHVGRFVVEFDPSAATLDRVLVTTSDPREARTFESMQEALAYWRQEHGSRPDGRPNRPLTAYTCEVQRRREYLARLN